MSNYNIKLMEDFFKTCEPASLSEIIDEAFFNIARCSVKESDIMMGDVDSQLFYLRQLRDVFNKVGQP